MNRVLSMALGRRQTTDRMVAELIKAIIL